MQSALRFVAEQMVVTLDQLVRFLGVDRDEALALVGEMEERRWATGKELLGDGVRWIWLRNAGRAECHAGFAPWSRRVSSLARRRAITEMRLLLEEELGGEWTSDRELRARYGRGPRQPVGVLDAGGETRAIFIFHRWCDPGEMEEALKRHSERHDAVECFCGSRKSRRTAELVKRRTGNARLIVRDLPKGLRVRPKRAPRARRPQADATQRSMLRLISEQGCMREDQLGRFFGLDGKRLVGVVDDLEQAGWVKRVKVLSGEPPWLWLRKPGMEQSGTGFGYLKPRLWRLGHRYAINEVRFEFAKEAPHGRWISERELRRELRCGGQWPGHLPDAVFEVDGRRFAIEVELTSKMRRDLHRILAQHNEDYDAVVYFCSRPARLVLEDVQRSLRNPKLVIRDAYRLPAKAARRPPPKRFEPLPEDIGTLTLLSEQGAIPLDQLTRFLERSESDAKDVMQGLVERGFVRSTDFLEAEPLWFWPRGGGARHSGTGLRILEPRAGALGKLRAANEARLLLAPPKSQRRWIGQRTLQKITAARGGLPTAVLVDGGERYAVEIILGMTREWHIDRVRDWSHKYDGVVCLCGSWRDPEQLAEEYSWSNVVVRELPGVPFSK